MTTNKSSFSCITMEKVLLEEEKKKTIFLFVFSTYLPVFLLKFRSRHHHHVFSGISYFWGSRVRQKHAVWVLVGCGIKFRIQRALPLEIWVKTQGYMLKIQTNKVVFFYDKYFNSTIMVDSFYWNSIGSWIPTHKIYCWHVFL